MEKLIIDRATWIERLLSSPEQVCQRPEVRHPAFVQVFLRHCVSEIFSDPTQGLARARIADMIVTTSCERVQVIGLIAICHRALGRPEQAADLVEKAWSLARDCPSCLADLFRRRAYVKRDLQLYPEALADATQAIDRYRALDDVGHDLEGNGLASAYLCRGQIRYEVGQAETVPQRARSLLSGSVVDISEALSRISPTVSPRLHRVGVYNLAAALAATGQRRDLLRADQHVRIARRLFKGVRKASLERAKLDWLTAMIRYELGSMKPYRVRAYLNRARDIFLELGILQEGLAVTADLARIAYPDRREVRTLVEAESIRDLIPRLQPEIQSAWAGLENSLDIRGWHGQDETKLAIATLRDACGPRMLSCLVSWRH